MKFKEFKNKSYGLEAKEVPPKPMTYADVKEDIRISDPKGSKKSEAEQYIDVYKDTHRGAPEIKNAKFREFTLSGKDEKLVADMVAGKNVDHSGHFSNPGSEPFQNAREQVAGPKSRLFA